MSLPPGSLLSEVIVYFRQYVKEGDTSTLPDVTIIDWINRFMLNKMPKRIQLWDYKRQFHIDLEKDVEVYYFPKDRYQNISQPVYIDGVQSQYYQSDAEFYRIYPEQIFNEQPLNGNGQNTYTYTYTLANIPIKPSFYDKPAPSSTTFNRALIPNFIISAIDETGNIEYIVDDAAGTINVVSGDIILNKMTNRELQTVQTSSVGTIDHITGALSWNFTNNIPIGNPITIQSIPYQANRPIAALFTDNYIKTYPIPDRAYRLTFSADITPAQFLTSIPPKSQELPFSYMGEYIGLGAAIMFMWAMRKEEQLRFYIPYFKETENELLRRSTRQEGTQRTKTIFSDQVNNQNINFNNYWR